MHVLLKHDTHPCVVKSVKMTAYLGFVSQILPKRLPLPHAEVKYWTVILITLEDEQCLAVDVKVQLYG